MNEPITKLRELAEEMRDAASLYAGWADGCASDARCWADKLESLAGECAVVPREPTAAMCMAANDAFPVSGETTCSEIGRTIYRAMIEAAERQEIASARALGAIVEDGK